MSKPDTPDSTPPACPARVVVGYLQRDGWAVPVYGEPTHAGLQGAEANTPPAPSVTSVPSGTNPHFARLGGVTIIEQLVDRFYALMDTLPEAATIRAMHGPNLAPVKEVLVRYITEWTGGPQVYSAERGHPRLRRKHLPFAIGQAERDAWMLCMTQALDEVVADPDLKDQLTRAFAKTADFIRNDKGSSHDHHSH
jgi:hemoglobin